MLGSQRKGLFLLVVLWADLGRRICSAESGNIKYMWNDLNLERQGIFTGNVNNHSVLAFIIKDHFPLTCATHETDETICQRKPDHIRTEVPLHESALDPFEHCGISRMAFETLNLTQEMRSQLNSTDYMIVWSLRIPRRSCVVLDLHINSSDASLSDGGGNRLYLEESGKFHHIFMGGEIEHQVKNWHRRNSKLIKVVYVQKADAETIDFHFTVQRTLVTSERCGCTQYRKRAIFRGT